jgi:hypothetical protein
MKFEQTNYWGGMPANESYMLRLDNGMAIQFNESQYQDLCKAISDKNETDIKEISAVTERVEAKRVKINAIVQGIIEIFYDQSDDILWARDIKEIDFNKIMQLIDNNSELLGLE